MTEFIDKGYRYGDLSFKELRMFRFKEDTGFTLLQDEKYPHMYYIEHKPDFKSRNFYNITNAKENTKLFYLKWKNSDVGNINEIKLSSSPREAQGEV